MLVDQGTHDNFYIEGQLRTESLAAAAKAKATLGEMCDVLRGVFGEYREGSDF